MQKIYLELVFLDNFIINLLIIFCASALTKAKIRLARFILAACAGGVYACMVFLIQGAGLSVGIKIAVSLLMCFIAFFSKLQKSFLKSVCAFYAVSFIFAGAIYAAMYSLGDPVLSGGAIAVRPLLRYILIGLGAGTVLVYVFSRIHKRVLCKESLTAKITLVTKGRQKKVKAFIDTGNTVRESLSGLGVIFVTQPVAKALFDKDILDVMLCRGDTPTKRLRIIACATAAGQSVFYGMEIDEAIFGSAKIRAVVCVAKGALAHGCDAIVGSTIMDELTKGAENEIDIGAKNSSVGDNTPGNSGKRRLYKRQRGASAAAVTDGRSADAAPSGRGGQLGTPRSDRAQSAACRLYRKKI